MDWIERLFHISPDGGNGATEAGMIVALVLAGIVGFRFWRTRRTARRQARAEAAPELEHEEAAHDPQ